MNLLDAIHKADPLVELSRDMPGMLDGVPVVIQAVLERVAVVRVDGEPCVVRIDRLEVDARRMRWQQRAELSQQQSYQLKLRHMARQRQRQVSA